MELKQAGIIGLAMIITGCGGVTSRVKNGTVQNVIDQSPNRMGYIESIGIGASDPALATETQRKALARDAAIVKAQYEMLSMVKGVELEGGVTVDRALETDSSLEARLRKPSGARRSSRASSQRTTAAWLPSGCPSIVLRN